MALLGRIIDGSRLSQGSLIGSSGGIGGWEEGEKLTQRKDGSKVSLS